MESYFVAILEEGRALHQRTGRVRGGASSSNMALIPALQPSQEASKL